MNIIKRVCDEIKSKKSMSSIIDYWNEVECDLFKVNKNRVIVVCDNLNYDMIFKNNIISIIYVSKLCDYRNIKYIDNNNDKLDEIIIDKSNKLKEIFSEDELKNKGMMSDMIDNIIGGGDGENENGLNDDNWKYVKDGIIKKLKFKYSELKDENMKDWKWIRSIIKSEFGKKCNGIRRYNDYWSVKDENGNCGYGCYNEYKKEWFGNVNGRIVYKMLVNGDGKNMNMKNKWISIINKMNERYEGWMLYENSYGYGMKKYYSFDGYRLWVSDSFENDMRKIIGSDEYESNLFEIG